MRRSLSLAVALVSSFWLVVSTAYATTANDICAPAVNPCLVTTDITVTPGSMLDFGTRALQVRPTGRLRITSGTLSILAGSLRIESGGLISGAVGPGSAASIDVHTTGEIRVDATNGRIDVSASTLPGSISLASDSGNVILAGRVEADGTGSNGVGGLIMVSAGGTLDVSGTIAARGGAPGLGGRASFQAGGLITMNGTVFVNGGDGGDVDVTSTAGDVTIGSTGNFELSGGGTFGDAGVIELIAHRHLTLNGTIAGRGAGSELEGGGFGAGVTLIADTGTISINGVQTLNGAAPDGEGGDFDAVAALDAIFGTGGRIFLNTGGIDACGGFFAVAAGRNATLGGTIDTTGGFCGGDISGDAGQQLSVSADLSGDGGLAGGSMTFSAQTLNSSGRLHANGTGTFAGGGYIQLTACQLTQASGTGSQLLANGFDGQLLAQASGQMTIGGTMRSTDGAIRLEYRQNLPIIQATATIVPDPDIVQNASLPACVAGAVCGNGTVELPEECDDGDTEPCDGCSASCTEEECGNGTVDCGEECDAGPANGAPGSRCDANCRTQESAGVLFLPGPIRGGCIYEWAVLNPGGAEKRGFPERTQACIDGDPACDADGADDGGCDFTVSGCLNVTDERLPGCDPAATEWVNLRRPSPLRPVDETEESNATLLVDALKALGITVRSADQELQTGVPDAQRDHCTAPVLLRVPHAPGVTGRRILHATAKDTAGTRGRRNRITLACAPNPSVCGNGVTEVTEACDDGNTADCDGCSASCRVERCGDGVVACGEQCDEGAANGTSGSMCTATCTDAPPALRITGGPGRNDCIHEWSLDHGSPVLQRNGLPSSQQKCVDGDPTCDFDPTPGNCRFHLWQCVGGADDRIGCVAQEVGETGIVRPSAIATGVPAAARQALLTALGALQLPAGPGEECGGRADVDLPAGSRRLVILGSGKTTVGLSDRDSLRLTCLPAP